MRASVTLFALIFLVKNSLQDCRSTEALTTCSWDTFTSTKSLHLANYKPHFTVSKGNLEKLPNGALKSMPEITTLQLSANKISRLEEGALEGLGKLKKLNLYDNRLTVIEQKSLTNCNSLEKLDLGMNQIASVDSKALENVQKLVELNLAFNLLKTVPKAINSLPNLQKLRLDNNQISILKAQAFSGLNGLRELWINDNKVAEIELNAFQGLAQLELLNLKANFLTTLNVDDIVDDVRNLQEVSVSLNDFKCDSLKEILDEFRKNHVQVTNGVSKNRNSINGISCKSL